MVYPFSADIIITARDFIPFFYLTTNPKFHYYVIRNEKIWRN